MSKKEAHRKNIEALAEDFRKEVVERAMRLYTCGGVDSEGYDPNSMLLAKLLLYVAMEDVGGNLKPLSAEGRAEVKNLKRF